MDDGSGACVDDGLIPVIPAPEPGSPSSTDSASITFYGDPRPRACGDDGGGTCRDDGAVFLVNVGQSTIRRMGNSGRSIAHARAYGREAWLHFPLRFYRGHRKSAFTGH